MAGTQAGAEERAMKKCWLLTWSPCFFFFLIQPRSTCPGAAPPRLYWVLSHQSSTKEKSHSVWWRKFLNWGFLLPGDSSLCQVDQNQAVQWFGEEAESRPWAERKGAKLFAPLAYSLCLQFQVITMCALVHILAHSRCQRCRRLSCVW